MNVASDSYVLERASLQASLLVSAGEFRLDDWPDLRQEFALDLLRRAPQFNPKRGDRRGFIRGVMKNYATVLVNHKRRRDQHEAPFEYVGDDLHPSVDPRAQLEIRIAVRRVVRCLSTPTKQILQLLLELSIPDICKKTGISRSEVYRTLRKVRHDFVRAGLAPTQSRRHQFESKIRPV
jgi:RNA polymerase sigma factor (sigma-70 family)